MNISFNNKSRPKRPNTAVKKLAYSLIILGLVFCIAGGYLLFKHSTPSPLPQLLAPQESQEPVEISQPTKSSIDNYHVAPDLPRYISIPEIGVAKTRVLTLGLESNGQITVPSSSYDTGWYDQSSKPGQLGAMFIYGHVAGWNKGGIFYYLKDLKSGQKIVITTGDNKTFTYQVDYLKRYPANHVDMNAVLSPVEPNRPGLNLMTCTWDIVNGKSQFNNRVVVFTSLVSNQH